MSLCLLNWHYDDQEKNCHRYDCCLDEYLKSSDRVFECCIAKRDCFGQCHFLDLYKNISKTKIQQKSNFPENNSAVAIEKLSSILPKMTIQSKVATVDEGGEEEYASSSSSEVGIGQSTCSHGCSN